MLLDMINKTFDHLGQDVCMVLLEFPELLKNLPEAAVKHIKILARLNCLVAVDCCKLLGLTIQPFTNEEADAERVKIFDPTIC